MRIRLRQHYIAYGYTDEAKSNVLVFFDWGALFVPSSHLVVRVLLFTSQVWLSGISSGVGFRKHSGIVSSLLVTLSDEAPLDRGPYLLSID
ncbi:MAG: hypothetical protein ACLP5V_15595 [Candidatus Bathyarchaeia archaeon]